MNANKGKGDNGEVRHIKFTSYLDEYSDYYVRIQLKGYIEKVYNNMSACHIKQGNWQRALETADKV